MIFTKKTLQFGQLVQFISDVKIQDLKVSLELKIQYIYMDIVDQLWKHFGWYRGALLYIGVDSGYIMGE